MIASTPPKSHPLWTINIPHPATPDERWTDDACDEHARREAPDGWHVRECYQARDRRGRRILRVTYIRPAALESPWTRVELEIHDIRTPAPARLRCTAPTS